MYVSIIILGLLAYCIGSLSSAVIVCKILSLPDPRNAGSNNPGATNVLRIGNKKAAIATLLGDAFKGMLAVWIAIKVNPLAESVGTAMVAVVLGHLFPIFFKFKGGKGVATAMGAILALSWPIGIMLILSWSMMAFFFRYSSLAALGAALLAPFDTLWILNWQFAIPVGIISALLFWRHRSNIQRLWQGKEPKIGQKN